MKVAFVTETFPPEANGAAMTAGRLVDALVEHGHDVRLVRPAPAGAAPPARPGVTPLFVPALPLPMYHGIRVGVPFASRLAARWSEERPDVVHIVTEGPLGWSALRVARRLGVPVSTGFHTNFHAYMRFYRLSWLTDATLAYLRWFHNAAAVTLVPTEQTRADLQRRGFRDVVVVSRGVDTRLYSPEKRRAELRQRWGAGRSPVVLVVGRVAPEKNLELAVEAFRAIRRSRPEARLVIVGDGPLRGELQARHPEFIFTGTLGGEELAAHYASADIFLFPSLTETFGNVVMEAMASGLAVVAFDDAAAREHIVDGRNGLVVAPGDRRSFVAAAAELSCHPFVVRRLGEQARRTTLDLSWDEVGARFQSLLKRVAAGEPVGENSLADSVRAGAAPVRRPRTQPA